MAATERLRTACARYEEFTRFAFREVARGLSAGRFPKRSWDERVTKPGYVAFWVATQEDWTLLAADLLRRWRLPEHRGGVEDMRQELAIGALKAFRRYAPGHGVELHEFVIWNALACAKKKLHKLRGAKLSGNSGKNPNRIERPFSSFGEEDSEGDGAVEAAMYSSGMVEDPAQSERMEFRERGAEVRRVVRTGVERVVLEVTFGGFGLDEGARWLYEDADMCLAHRIGSEEAAGRAVGRAALALAGRIYRRDEEEVA